MSWVDSTQLLDNQNQSMKNRITVRLTEDQIEKLNYILEQKKVDSLAELIRGLIEEEYERLFLNKNNDYISRIIRLELSNILHLYFKK